VLNAEVLDATLRSQTKITHSARTLMSEAMKKLGMSARGYTRVLRVAVTIADLAEGSELTDEIVAEAISYRSLDRLTNLLHHGTPFSGGRMRRGLSASA
jgi:magnesium chelatase family protein